MTPSAVERRIRAGLLVIRFLQTRLLRLTRGPLRGATARAQLPADVGRQAVSADGVPCEWLIPQNSPPDLVLVYLHDGGVVAGLYRQDPAQAAAWTALKSVEVGITSGNELVGSLWLLLLSAAALRTGRLSRPLSWLGVALGVVGILTLVPALYESLRMVFGLGMIVWSVWVGIVLLRQRHVAATQPATTFTPRHKSTSLSS